jgi:hypothetical protein
VSEKKTIDVCSCCGTKARYDDLDEAWYCPCCRVWLEEPCRDPDCFICRERAEKPPASETE